MRQMKDSGIEWIGEIPEGWEVRKIKNIAFPKSIQNHPQEEVLSLYRDFGVIIKSSRDDNFNRTSENTTNYKFVEVGDLVINKMKAWQGSLAISWYQGIVSPAYYVFKLTSDIIEKKFLHYLLRSSSYLPEYRRISGGIRPNQWDLDITEFKKIPVLIPPLPEQQRIADYLDAKCAHIDQCLELTRQSMEKLRAYKLSCITEAVTKGLDPDVPLKDSGVPWIGQIPQHCRCVAVNKLFYLILGKMLSDKPKNHDDSLEEYICALNVHFYGIDYDSLKKMWFSKNEKFTYKVMNNDLLVVEGGAGAGGSYIATNIQNKKIYIQNSIIIAREKESISNTRFLYYTLFSLVKRNYIDFICNKATIPHFTKEKLGRTVLVLFPLPEQERIAAYLDKKCARIDALLEEKQALLDKLAEYKKSLIFECVTGKREVPSCWNR